MERSLLYVSRKTRSILNDERVVTDIVNRARLHNEQIGITGALACTENHFAQLLEGPKVILDDLMHRIECDARHTDFTILRLEAIPCRRLPSWSMAYSGVSHYVSRQIAPLIGATIGNSCVHVDRLITLLIGLANHPGTSRNPV